jgi:hypothetical protein
MRPALPEAAVAWELRGAWAAAREVVLVLGRAAGRPPRVRGYVQHVAATGAFALVWDGGGESHVPLALVRAVRRPHFHEARDGGAVAPPPLRPRAPAQLPGQLTMELGDRRAAPPASARRRKPGADLARQV